MTNTPPPPIHYDPAHQRVFPHITKHVPWAVMLLIILSPLDPYRIPLLGFNWSLQRLFLLAYIPIFFTNTFMSKRIALRPPHFFTIGVFLSILISTFASDIDWGLFKNYAVIDFLNLLIFLIIYQKASENHQNRKAILHAFFIFACLYLLYAIYTGMMLWIFRAPITEAPFINQIPFVEENPTSRLEKMYYARRFCLPFGVPQALGIVAGLLSFIFSAQRISDRSGKWGVITSALLLVMILTFSRSAILAVVCGYTFIIWNTIFNPNRIGSIMRRIVAFVGIAVLLFSILILVLSESGFNVPLMRIFQLANIGQSEHMEIRMIALRAWLDQGPIEMLFGIGVGNFSRVGEAWRAHMTYANVLVERGLIGLFFSCAIFAILPVVFGRRYRKGRRPEDLIWFGASIAIFLSHVFYAFFSYTALWMIYAYLCAQAWPQYVSLPRRKLWPNYQQLEKDTNQP